jgi:TonB family protein
MSRPQPSRREQGCPHASANERLKERWGTILRRSALVAVAAHLAVLFMWPGWAPAPSEPGNATAAMQVIEVAPVEVASALWEAPEPEARRSFDAEPAAPTAEGEAMLDHLELPEPAISVPDAAGVAHVSAPAPQVAMVLDPVSIARALEMPSPPGLIWPEILNPRQMTRFLSQRYNPLHSSAVAGRFVSVAMTIDRRGTVEWIDVHESSGSAALDQIAVDMFSSIVEFAPARRSGVATAVTLVITVPFNRPW